MPKPKKHARFTLGVDVWECPDCKLIVFMGKPCTCGKTYADVLKKIAVDEAKKKPKREKPDGIKYRPKSKGKFIESYLYRTDDE